MDRVSVEPIASQLRVQYSTTRSLGTIKAIKERKHIARQAQQTSHRALHQHSLDGVTIPSRLFWPSGLNFDSCQRVLKVSRWQLQPFDRNIVNKQRKKTRHQKQYLAGIIDEAGQQCHYSLFLHFCRAMKVKVWRDIIAQYTHDSLPTEKHSAELDL